MAKMFMAPCSFLFMSLPQLTHIYSWWLIMIN